ncbi:MAG: OmpA family protein [Spirochaetaceae bacterium]|nr:MAG: OmpA family protein [Spirochaetaceae bacterium]
MQGRIAIYDIRFDADSARIRPESSGALSRVAEFLRANPNRRYFIVGHAAGIGDFTTGLSLSRDRAAAVLNELVERHGVSRTQLAAHGVGALSPVASNRSPEGAAMNRQVELVEQ